MKKSILNLGTVLNKVQQKQVNGGRKQCDANRDGECEDFGRQCAEFYCRFILQ
ncbi:hypothetical protein [uncultured Tenacibaculum sp.]|uniref:hypothetical protein n=1 Tax=uncultured Tenacibaculum sp. TaxID=174713 RepID=UPI00260F25A6|nr:hypothetical protein [uncultured Tenacibaculum sp.]